MAEVSAWPVAPPATGGRLADNVARFVRLLRSTGLPVGPDRALQALQALEAVGLARRDDVHAALSATLLDRHAQQAVFDAAFDAFWRVPELRAAAPGDETADAAPSDEPVGTDAAAAGAGGAPMSDITSAPAVDGRTAPSAPVAAIPGFSAVERLWRLDIGRMTAAELDAAGRLAERLPLPVQPVSRRRRHPATPLARGTLDLRATLQRSARAPDSLLPAWRRARRELPPVVVLLDVSGSMERYAHLFLHYAHGLLRRHLEVHVFTFGTRLTNITRCLRERDPAVALRLAVAEVRDWRGGTRIGASLDEFNRRWARRVLGRNAALLLVTDGLDREDPAALAAAAAQLHRLAHEVVWLNPLLRYAGFQPRAAGVRALLPHVDRLLPVHDLDSLAALGRALAQSPGRARRPAPPMRPSG